MNRDLDLKISTGLSRPARGHCRNYVASGFDLKPNLPGYLPIHAFS